MLKRLHVLLCSMGPQSGNKANKQQMDAPQLALCSLKATTIQILVISLFITHTQRVYKSVSEEGVWVCVHVRVCVRVCELRQLNSTDRTT